MASRSPRGQWVKTRFPTIRLTYSSVPNYSQSVCLKQTPSEGDRKLFFNIFFNLLLISVLLQLHLQSQFNSWLQYIAQRQLQDETRIISVLGFDATYIRGLMVGLLSYTGPALEQLENKRFLKMFCDFQTSEKWQYILVCLQNILFLNWNYGVWTFHKCQSQIMGGIFLNCSMWHWGNVIQICSPNPSKLCNHKLRIGIIIFPHTDNPPSTSYN